MPGGKLAPEAGGAVGMRLGGVVGPDIEGVVAGGGDTPAGLLAVGCTDEDRAMISLGTGALVVAASLNDASAGLVGREVIDALAPGAVVANVARGGLVENV